MTQHIVQVVDHSTLRYRTVLRTIDRAKARHWESSYQWLGYLTRIKEREVPTT